MVGAPNANKTTPGRIPNHGLHVPKNGFLQEQVHPAARQLKSAIHGATHSGNRTSPSPNNQPYHQAQPTPLGS